MSYSWGKNDGESHKLLRYEMLRRKAASLPTMLRST